MERGPRRGLSGRSVGASSEHGAAPYSEFRTRKTIAQIKELFETGRIHLERSRGNWEQNRDYCTKTESREAGPWEFGTHLPQGRRSDLGEVAGMVLGGSSFFDIARAHPTTWIRYGKGVVALRAAVLDKPRDWPADVHVFVGPTGTGKSRAAHAEGGDSIYVLCDPTGKWWDGYAGHETVIIDDYRGEIGFTYLLKLPDASSDERWLDKPFGAPLVYYKQPPARGLVRRQRRHRAAAPSHHRDP